METYITLGKFSQQGVDKIKESPARIEAMRKVVEAVGGKFIAWYLTMGRYDWVAITQSPNPQVTAAVLLALGKQGNVTTETLHAFTEEEFKGIVASMPQ